MQASMAPRPATRALPAIRTAADGMLHRFLDAQRMLKYEEVFQKNGITFDKLLRLDAADLKALGVVAKGAQVTKLKKIRHRIQRPMHTIRTDHNCNSCASAGELLLSDSHDHMFETVP